MEKKRGMIGWNQPEPIINANVIGKPTIIPGCTCRYDAQRTSSTGLVLGTISWRNGKFHHRHGDFIGRDAGLKHPSSWDLQRVPRKSRIQTTNEAMNHQSLLKMEKLDEISPSGHKIRCPHCRIFRPSRWSSSTCYSKMGMGGQKLSHQFIAGTHGCPSPKYRIS